MKKPILLLDMDDVCACHNERWVESFFQKTGITLNSDEWTGWNLAEIYPEDMIEPLYSILKEPGFFRHLEPKEGCVEGIKTLLEHDFDIVFLTASPPHAYQEKYEWLEEHLPFVPKPNLVLTHRKDLVHGDFLVDDGPHNLLDSPAKIKIAFDHAYNRSLTQFPRVKNWNELVPFLLNQVKEKTHS